MWSSISSRSSHVAILRCVGLGGRLFVMAGITRLGRTAQLRPHADGQDDDEWTEPVLEGYSIGEAYPGRLPPRGRPNNSRTPTEPFSRSFEIILPGVRVPCSFERGGQHVEISLRQKLGSSSAAKLNITASTTRFRSYS